MSCEDGHRRTGPRSPMSCALPHCIGHPSRFGTLGRRCVSPSNTRGRSPVPHRACGDLSGGSGVTRFPTATATRVNVEQASKRATRGPTRRITGKADTGREASDARTGRPRRGIDGGTHGRGGRWQHGKPFRNGAFPVKHDLRQTDRSSPVFGHERWRLWRVA